MSSTEVNKSSEKSIPQQPPPKTNPLKQIRDKLDLIMHSSTEIVDQIRLGLVGDSKSTVFTAEPRKSLPRKPLHPNSSVFSGNGKVTVYESVRIRIKDCKHSGQKKVDIRLKMRHNANHIATTEPPNKSQQ